MITSLAPVHYDPGRDAPKWVRFLARVFAGDLVMVDAGQRMVGYFMTGLGIEHHICIS